MKLRLAWRHVAVVLLFTAARHSAAVRSREVAATPSLSARLQKVQDLLEAEAQQDRKVSQRTECWCKGLVEQRRYADDLSLEADRLTHEVQAKTAENARLAAELQGHRKDLEDGERSLSQAVAIRDKAARKYDEEHTLTSQSINQLDGALEALKDSHGHELSVVQQMRRLLDGSGERKRAAMLQLRRRLDAASSPQMVYGVLKQMRETFAANLKDMQEDESLLKSRHDELSRAKAREIETIKRQVLAKQQRAAEGSLHVSRQKEVLDRTGKLLEATRTAIGIAEKACSSGEQAAEERQRLRQQGLVSLSQAKASLAGMQLLATSRDGAARALGGGAEDLCLLAATLSEQRWRERAKVACAAAKAGRTQDAAEAVEALEEEIGEAARSKASDLEQCERAHQEAASQRARAAKDVEVRVQVVSGTKQGADSQIEEVEAQAAFCEKAKAEFSDIHKASQAFHQGVRMDASRIAALVQPAGAPESSAVQSELQKVAASANKMAEASAKSESAEEEGARAVAAALDAARLAASKVLIPLRSIRADAEEAVVSAHEEQEMSAHSSLAGRPACDATALSAEVRRLKGHAASLEKATISLAWGSLR